LRPSAPRIDDAALRIDDAIDWGRFPKPKNEVRRGLWRPPGALTETMDTGRAAKPGLLGDGGARVLLAAMENGRVIVPLPIW
jgi:hypothetical protein